MKVEKLFVFEKDTIRNCLKKLNSTGKGCLIVVDKKKRLLGTLTDGDCRRAFLNSANLKNAIKKYYNKKSIYVTSNYNNFLIKRKMKKNKIELLPLLNPKNKKVVSYIDLDELEQKKKFNKNKQYNTPIVIMAGGLGSRMKPFTNILPKPLLPLENQTVIEKIIENFTICGFNNFYISINYKSKIIKSFFDEIINKDYKVTFIEEKKTLGTIGSISLLKKKIKGDFFVCNCDTIMEIDFKNLLKFHKEKKDIITLVAHEKNLEIPYGVCALDKNGKLSAVNEKPKKNFLVNTGLYVLNSKIFNFLEINKKADMNQMIDKILKNSKEKIAVFPSYENQWFDVGEWKGYLDLPKLLKNDN